MTAAGGEVRWERWSEEVEQKLKKVGKIPGSEVSDEVRRGEIGEEVRWEFKKYLDTYPNTRTSNGKKEVKEGEKLEGEGWEGERDWEKPDEADWMPQIFFCT